MAQPLRRARHGVTQADIRIREKQARTKRFRKEGGSSRVVMPFPFGVAVAAAPPPQVHAAASVLHMQCGAYGLLPFAAPRAVTTIVSSWWGPRWYNDDVELTVVMPETPTRTPGCHPANIVKHVGLD